jgi:hypothetical protein
VVLHPFTAEVPQWATPAAPSRIVTIAIVIVLGDAQKPGQILRMAVPRR